MPHSRERGNPECTHPAKQVSRILLPNGAPSCLCYPGQTRISANSEAPSKPREKGSAPQIPAPQLLSSSSHCPTAVRASPKLTSDDNARQRPQRQQSGPELSQPPRSHPVHCLSRRERAPRRAWRPRLLFLTREGREDEGRGLGGWDTAGRAECSRSLPPAPAWTLPEAECDGETLRASSKNLPQLSTHKDPPAFPRGDPAPGGPVCIWVPCVYAWVLGLKKKK